MNGNITAKSYWLLVGVRPNPNVFENCPWRSAAVLCPAVRCSSVGRPPSLHIKCMELKIVPCENLFFGVKNHSIPLVLRHSETLLCEIEKSTLIQDTLLDLSTRTFEQSTITITATDCVRYQAPQTRAVRFRPLKRKDYTVLFGPDAKRPGRACTRPQSPLRSLDYPLPAQGCS